MADFLEKCKIFKNFQKRPYFDPRSLFVQINSANFDTGVSNYLGFLIGS